MTNAELAILTLIAEQPRHGYEIEQVIEARGMREWTEIGFSSIYYLTKKLQKDGLIEAHTEQAAGRGPARKVYHITQAGVAALQAGLLEALTVPQPHHTGFSLAIGNLPVVPSAEAVTALRKHQETLVDQLVRVQTRWEEQKPLPYFVDALFDYSVAMIEARKTWLEKFIVEMEGRLDNETDPNAA
jgi:DNA-binding PadR family transcriptional regulator